MSFQPVKPEWEAVADVLVFGPTMIVGGNQLRRQHPMTGWALLLLGVGCILYNGAVYAKIQGWVK